MGVGQDCQRKANRVVSAVTAESDPANCIERPRVPQPLKN